MPNLSSLLVCLAVCDAGIPSQVPAKKDCEIIFDCQIPGLTPICRRIRLIAGAKVRDVLELMSYKRIDDTRYVVWLARQTPDGELIRCVDCFSIAADPTAGTNYLLQPGDKIAIRVRPQSRVFAPAPTSPLTSHWYSLRAQLSAWVRLIQ